MNMLPPARELRIDGEQAGNKHTCRCKVHVYALQAQLCITGIPYPITVPEEGQFLMVRP